MTLSDHPNLRAIADAAAAQAGQAGAVERVAAADGWDDVSGAALLAAAADAIAWALLDATSDIADRAPSEETFREAVATAQRILIAGNEELRASIEALADHADMALRGGWTRADWMWVGNTLRRLIAPPPP